MKRRKKKEEINNVGNVRMVNKLVNKNQREEIKKTKKKNEK